MRTSRIFFIGLSIVLLALGISSPVHAQYILTPGGWQNDNTGGKLQWDGVNTGRLAGDVTGTILIQGQNLILDGNGHSLSGVGVGITIQDVVRSGNLPTAVTVKNFSNIIGFTSGIKLTSNSNIIDKCNIIGNTITECGTGIDIAVTSKANRNHVIDGNTLDGNGTGISLVGISNTSPAAGDTVRNNTILNIGIYGLYLNFASNTVVYHNNLIGNGILASVAGGILNSFNRPAPVGGNFWSTYTSPDANADGFVDTPYTGTTFSDALPWTTKSGWAGTVDTQAPVTTESHSGTVGNGGWYITDVSVTLSAVDLPNPGGSGVKLTQYQLNTDQNLLPFDPPFSITAEGTTAFYYRSIDNAGNVEGLKTFSVNIDKTAPTTTASPAGTAGNNGWFKSDVTVNLSATDNVSGVFSTQYSTDGSTWQTGSVAHISTEGITTLYFRSTDNAGNVEAAKTISLKIDKTPPVLVVSRTPDPNANGWNNTDVTASYTATDAVSGLLSPASGSFAFTAEGQGQTHTFTVTDQAGNEASAVVDHVNIDKTAPVVAITRTPAPNVNGWNNTDVTASYTATDALSGVPAGSTGSFTFTTDGTNQSHTFTVVDAAGNSATAQIQGINIDKTPPTVTVTRTPDPNANGWNNTDVIASYSASDAGSGLASPATGTFLFAAEGQGQSHNFVVADQAGNEATAVVDHVNIDKSAPVITGPSTLSFGNDPGTCGRLATNVNLQVTVVDELSGLTLSSSTAPGTFPRGMTAVVWTATDKAGNTATMTQSITINDLEPPVIFTPADITTGTNNGNCGAIVNFPAPQVTDNCSGVTVSFTPPSGSTFAVGTTVVQITAKDASGNTNSSSFKVTVIDTPPTLAAITAPLSPVTLSTEVSVSSSFTDPDVGDPHTATWEWGDGTTSAGVINQTAVTGKHTYALAGVYALGLSVTDGCGAQASSTFQYLVVYNPDGGFVTGGGWISSAAGAYVKDPTLAGKANLGFVVKYLPGSSVPQGNNAFQLKPSLKFAATGYEWLVISGAKAMATGSGTINGSGNYGFFMAAIDGKLEGSGKADRLRMKIWDKNNSNALVYDNQAGAAEDADPTAEGGGGSIVVHKADAGTSAASAGLSADIVADEGTAVIIPTEYALYNSYPNPFNPSTTIRYDLPEAAKVRMVVYDMLGREAAVLVDGEKPAGQYSVRFDAGKLSSGMYIYRFQAGNFVQTKKLVLMK